MSENEMIALLVLNVGPFIIVIGMIIWGVKLIETKPDQKDPPSTGQKVAGGFLILLALGIMFLYLATKFEWFNGNGKGSSSSAQPLLARSP